MGINPESKHAEPPGKRKNQKKPGTKMAEPPHMGTNPESKHAEPPGKRQNPQKPVQKWQNLPTWAQIVSPNTQNL